MLIKLGIIAGIVILAGMIFSTEIDTLFPNSSATVVDSLKDDVTTLGATASDSVEQSLAKSFDKMTDTTSDSISNELSQVGNSINEEISEVKESSHKIINEEIPDLNPIEYIKSIFTNNSESSPLSNSESSPLSNSESITDPRIHETLSLSTKQQSEGNILLQYADSSGKTESVSVVIRTDQKEIFSGTFFISMFETIIDDIGAPYYVDMIVEHEDYGTIISSVFNPNEASDTTIYGIFSQ